MPTKATMPYYHGKTRLCAYCKNPITGNRFFVLAHVEVYTKTCLLTTKARYCMECSFKYLNMGTQLGLPGWPVEGGVKGVQQP